MSANAGRQHRVADYLQRELATVIRDGIRDPRLQAAGLLTVNEVQVTRDLAYADVYVTCMNDNLSMAGDEAQRKAEHDDVIERLNAAAGFLRSEVARESTMRTTPKLRFHYDDGIEHGMKMDKLIAAAVRKDRK